jgi:hypothetical protein
MNNYTYKSINKDILKSIISKSIFYVRKMALSIHNDGINPYKSIRLAYRDKQTKMYMIVLSDKLPPLICKSKKECITDEHLNDMKIKLFRKTPEGITQFTINYMNIPIGLIDDSPTFLNSLSNDERAFMEHFIGLLTKQLKNTNTNVNIKASNFFKNVQYPVKINLMNKKNNRKTVKWNNKVRVRIFQRNKNVPNGEKPANSINTFNKLPVLPPLPNKQNELNTTENGNNNNNNNNNNNIPNFLRVPFKRRRTVRNNTRENTSSNTNTNVLYNMVVQD